MEKILLMPCVIVGLLSGILIGNKYEKSIYTIIATEHIIRGEEKVLQRTNSGCIEFIQPVDDKFIIIAHGNVGIKVVRVTKNDFIYINPGDVVRSKDIKRWEKAGN